MVKGGTTRLTRKNLEESFGVEIIHNIFETVNYFKALAMSAGELSLLIASIFTQPSMYALIFYIFNLILFFFFQFLDPLYRQSIFISHLHTNYTASLKRLLIINGRDEQFFNRLDHVSLKLMLVLNAKSSFILIAAIPFKI